MKGNGTIWLGRAAAERYQGTGLFIEPLVQELALLDLEGIGWVAVGRPASYDQTTTNGLENGLKPWRMV